MSIKINLGNWSSVFAVPSAVVDTALKFASAYQLKVLLYVLRNNDHELTYDLIAAELSILPDDVKDSVKFWVDRGIFCCENEELLPGKATANKTPALQNNTATQTKNAEFANIQAPQASGQPAAAAKPRTTVVQKPDSLFVAEKLKTDAALRDVIQDAEIILSKPLTPGDVATLVMLNYTFGLPCEVIIMLIQYCKDVGHSNMKYVERIGAEWSDEGIDSIEAAELKTESMKSSNSAWSKISRLFGVSNIGYPTAAQLSFAQRWQVEIVLPDELFKEAYERCVDTHGKYNLKYINGILNNWASQNIKNLNELYEFEEQMLIKKEAAKTKTTAAAKTTRTAKNGKKNRELSEVSLDVAALSKKDILDD
ncbi:MAG: DnaD domain protein [Oscillospiraceae bacterium]|jgi:DnaD/phage-associated family protein|nr:DnaD domain protein [Oscillospiraceae bacterium]